MEFKELRRVRTVVQDVEMCSPADNLQTTDVIGRVVLLLFLLCFEAVDGLFLLR